MDSIKTGQINIERIALDERERIAGLGLYIEADNIEARAMIAHRGSACTTE